VARPSPAASCAQAQTARLACRRGAALGSNQHRHKAGALTPTAAPIVSPHREQPTDDAIAARDLGMLAPSSKLSATIRAFSCASSVAPALPVIHLDTTIRIAFLPGIKHGICIDSLQQSAHAGCIADQPRDREVGASYRLLRPIPNRSAIRKLLMHLR